MLNGDYAGLRQDYGCKEANWPIVPSYNPRYSPYYDGHVRLQTVRLMDGSLNKSLRQINTNFGSLIKAEVSAPQSNYPRTIQIAAKFIW